MQIESMQVNQIQQNSQVTLARILFSKHAMSFDYGHSYNKVLVTIIVTARLET